MNQLVMNLINGVIPSLVVFVVGAALIYFVKGINLISNNPQIMNVVSTVANNENLRSIAKNLCIYAQKYVSTIAIEKLTYVVEEIKKYCKQSGITITEAQVIEIAQTAYDEHKEEIKENKFVQNLEKIFKDKDNVALINN